MPGDGRWLFAVLLGAVATATAACTHRSPDLAGRPCADGECVTGYKCHPERDICAPDVAIDRATVAPGRGCPAEGTFIDCRRDKTGCEAGCYTCREDLVWSECSVECVGLDLVTYAADGTIASRESCETESRCSGAGLCNEALKECEVLPQAPAGTPCDEADQQNDNFCDSICDGDGACVAGTPDCDDNTVCTVDSCANGAGCVNALIDCSGTAGDCHGDNDCDPNGARPNCDRIVEPLNEGNACTDCASTACEACASGVCGDLPVCNGAPPSAACYADADCDQALGCVAAECNGVGCAGAILEHRACANVAGAGWIPNAPCESVTCSRPNSSTSNGAVGTHCLVSSDMAGQSAVISYRFNTSSPDGTLFNIWMHNIGDTEWDDGEHYSCTLTGVTGGSELYLFAITETGLAGTVRHGQNCSDISSFARYCWMAADFDADDQMDPFPLDQGPHELSCGITLTGYSEDAGFDGFIFTADLGFVPDEAPGGICQHGDADFNAGTCKTNWGPNTFATPGHCSKLLAADAGSSCSPCTGGGTCSVCWEGDCRDAGTCDDTEPCNTDAECEMLGGACVEAPDDCYDVVCAGATFELQACADTMDGDDWGAGKPCESALCGRERYAGNPTGVGEDCYSYDGNLALMRYTFNTASPSGTPFFIWMRNIADSDTSTPYECTITGAAGIGTAVFSYTMADVRGTSRHGDGCGEFDATPDYCWMAADSDANTATYDPIPLDQGRHVLSCRIETEDLGHSAGFDGIVFTSDPSYVPEELDGPEACADSDANFTTNCSNTNWGPGVAPATGVCGTAIVADNVACEDGSGVDGVCCNGTCAPLCP